MHLGSAHTSLLPTGTSLSFACGYRCGTAIGRLNSTHFLQWLEELYQGSILKLDGKSCETISDELYENIAANYPGRDVWIEVSEDGECGSYSQYVATEQRK